MTQFERTYNFMKRPWVMAIYIILIILSYNFLDKPIAYFFHAIDFRNNMRILNWLSALGKAAVYVCLFFLAAIYFRYIKKNAINDARAWYLLSCVVVTNIICFILKVIFGRARPDLLFKNDPFGFYWFKLKDVYWSFPSGHSMTVIGLVAGLGVVFPNHFFSLLGVALLVVLSRICLYRHYLSDVMAGFYLSILTVGLLTHYLRTHHYLDKVLKK